MDGFVALLAPLDEPELAEGLRAAVLPALAAFALGASARLRGGSPAPVGGLVFAVAALLAFDLSHDVPAELVVGVAACALGGLLSDLLPVSPIIGACALVPGALVVAGSLPIELPGDDRIREVAVVVTISGGGALVASFDRRWSRFATAPVLFVVTIGGVYATVPDTELALASLGSAAVVAVLGWPLRLVRIGGAGAGAAVAALAWATAVDGAGRDGSVVGGLACLGLLAIDPGIRLLGERSPLRRVAPGARVGVVLATHAAVVLWMARVAGLRKDASTATVLVALGFLVSGTLWALGGRAPRPSGSTRARRYSPHR